MIIELVMPRAGLTMVEGTISAWLAKEGDKDAQTIVDTWIRYVAEGVTDMVNIGEEFGAKWYICGKRSVKGHPHHPLYLKSTLQVDLFTDIKEYLDSLK